MQTVIHSKIVLHLSVEDKMEYTPGIRLKYSLENPTCPLHTVSALFELCPNKKTRLLNTRCGW